MRRISRVFREKRKLGGSPAICTGWSVKAALTVCTEQEVRGCDMQFSEKAALQTKETGNAKFLSMFREWLEASLAGGVWGWGK